MTRLVPANFSTFTYSYFLTTSFSFTHFHRLTLFIEVVFFPIFLAMSNPTHPLKIHSKKISSVKIFLTFGTQQQRWLFSLLLQYLLYSSYHVIYFLEVNKDAYVVSAFSKSYLHTEVYNLNTEMDIDKRGNE